MNKLISTNPAKDYQKIGEVVISSLSEIKEKVKLANQSKKNMERFRRQGEDQKIIASLSTYRKEKK